MKRRLPLAALLLLLSACGQPPAPAESPTSAPVATAAPPAPEPAARPEGQVPRAFACRGNDPTWALDIDGSGANLRSADGETRFDGGLAAKPDGSFGFSGIAADSGGQQLDARLAPGQCVDTLAEGPAQPFTARVSLPDGVEAAGCCRAAFGLDIAAAPEFDASGKAPEDWSRWLADLAPAIARCSQDAGVDTADVPVAWPMNHGKATVRLRDSSGARFDCLVDLGSRRIENVSPVPESDTHPGEGEPRWLPARETPPVLDCGAVEQVRLGGDAVLGYLHYPAGCPGSGRGQDPT